MSEIIPFYRVKPRHRQAYLQHARLVSVAFLLLSGQLIADQSLKRNQTGSENRVIECRKI